MVSTLLDYQPPLNSRYISIILNEVEEIGWGSVKQIDDTFTNVMICNVSEIMNHFEIEFRISDERLILKFDAKYPESTPYAVT